MGTMHAVGPHTHLSDMELDCWSPKCEKCADTAGMAPDDPDYWRDHPNPTDEELHELCEAWLTYQREDHGDGVDETDPNWWAVEAAMDAESELERICRVIRGLCEIAAPDDPAVEMIGAGPLESMFFQYGDTAMDLVEPAAEENATLLAALRHVWAFDEPVRPRIDRFLLRLS